MIKNIILFAVLIALFTFWNNELQAQFGNLETKDLDKPVVVELFTSQSCSSCPPADKNLAKLSENPNVIALGFHVTYWNHLHWKDTLSNQFSTDRQRAYARHKGNGRVYTPQMVVNGGDEFVGSRSGSIKSSLNRAQEVDPIQVAEDGDKLTVTLPSLKDGNYTLWLAGTKDTHTQEIPSGENRGRTVTYHNAVLHYEKAGNWDGFPQELSFDKPAGDIDNYVVLAQEGGYGPIIAAGKN